MKRFVIQYTVKPEHAEHNAELMRAVFDELEQQHPDGVRYATLRLADGVTFIHISEEQEGEPSRLSGLESVQRFRAELADRCDGPPTLQEAHELGSFRLFASS